MGNPEKTKEELSEENLALKTRLSELESRVRHVIGDMEEANLALQREIDDRIIAQEELIKSEEKFRSLLRHSPDFIVEIDKECEVIYSNREDYREKGRTEIGKNAIEIIMPEFRDEFTILLRNAFLKRRPGSMVHKNRNDEIFLSRLAPIIHSGEVISVMLISTDITDQKTAENKIRELNAGLERMVADRTAQLREAYEKLNASLENEKELGDLKTRFISMVSHEYRTPLAVILASTYLLDKFHEIGDNDGFAKHRDRIRISVDAMTRLIDDVIIVGGSSDGRMSYKPRTFNAVKLFEDVIEEEKALDNYKHEFVFDNKVESKEIFSDSRLIRLVLCNLISNARKFSPDGSLITVKASDDSFTLKFSVADNGIGIPPELGEGVFEAFSRKKQDIGVIQGVGLGLNIVKRCVDSMKGKIYYKSEYKLGSEFTVEIP